MHEIVHLIFGVGETAGRLRSLALAFALQLVLQLPTAGVASSLEVNLAIGTGGDGFGDIVREGDAKVLGNLQGAAIASGFYKGEDKQRDWQVNGNEANEEEKAKLNQAGGVYTKTYKDLKEAPNKQARDETHRQVAKDIDALLVQQAFSPQLPAGAFPRIAKNNQGGLVSEVDLNVDPELPVFSSVYAQAETGFANNKPVLDTEVQLSLKDGERGFGIAVAVDPIDITWNGDPTEVEFALTPSLLMDIPLGSELDLNQEEDFAFAFFHTGIAFENDFLPSDLPDETASDVVPLMDVFISLLSVEDEATQMFVTVDIPGDPSKAATLEALIESTFAEHDPLGAPGVYSFGPHPGVDFGALAIAAAPETRLYARTDSFGMVSVPEPGTLLLLGLAAVGLSTGRRLSGATRFRTGRVATRC